MKDGDLNLKEFLKELGWDDNKFYKNIDKICSKEAYDFEKAKFTKAGKVKEDYYNDERSYVFKEQWKDIANVLFTMFANNPYYRDNSTAKSKSLDDIIKYNKECLELVDKKLSDYNRRQIQSHPVYQTTYMETLLLNDISDKIMLLLTTISKVPIEARTQTLFNLDGALNQLIIQAYSMTENEKKKIEEDKENFKDVLYGEYEHTSLDKYVAQVLKKEMNTQYNEKRMNLINEYDKAAKEVDEIILSNMPNLAKLISENKHTEKVDVLKELAKKSLEANEKAQDNYIKDRLIEAQEIIRNRIDIVSLIQAMINAEKQFKKVEDNDTIIRLEKIKVKVKNDIEEANKFKEYSDKLLCGLSYDIMNRK